MRSEGRIHGTVRGKPSDRNVGGITSLVGGREPLAGRQYALARVERQRPEKLRNGPKPTVPEGPVPDSAGSEAADYRGSPEREVRRATDENSAVALDGHREDGKALFSHNTAVTKGAIQLSRSREAHNHRLSSHQDPAVALGRDA